MPHRRDDDVHFGDDLPDARADIGINVSTDGLRVASDLANVRPLKRARHKPDQLDDSYAQWVPVPDEDLGEVQAVADTVSSFDMPPEDDDSGKRKRYQSSDAVRAVCALRMPSRSTAAQVNDDELPSNDKPLFGNLVATLGTTLAND
ncbi:hypothetical protein B0H11DRAFT_2215784 [Mycena galericulata]|nr:hypothetical protein B0H11DRAFT_2215784 [Mycena galericulata]